MLVEIDKKLDAQRKTLLKLETEAYKSGLESYEKDYQKLCDSIVAVEEVYKHAAEDLEKQGLTLSEDAFEGKSDSWKMDAKYSFGILELD
jgi:hypothetical protein